MRVLALDIGEKRIGLAVSDASGRVASPLKVLPAQDVLSCARSFRVILEDYEVELLLAGLPLSLSGEEGVQAVKVRKVATDIAKAVGLPLEFQDERLSSEQAKRMLREDGLDVRASRGKVDMIAASLFLQVWLDSVASSCQVEE